MICGMLGGHGDQHTFLSLDRLVQAVAPVPVGHPPAGGLVDDDDFVLIDEVVLAAAEARLGVDGPRGVLDRWLADRAIALELEPI